MEGETASIADLPATAGENSRRYIFNSKLFALVCEMPVSGDGHAQKFSGTISRGRHDEIESNLPDSDS